MDSRILAEEFHNNTAVPPHPVERFGRGTRCSECPTAESCAGRPLAALGLRVSTRRIKRGDALCHADSDYTSLYVVRFGAFASRMTAADGRRQIVAFPLAGDVIGLDAIATGHHSMDTVALQDSEVCAVVDPERSMPAEVQCRSAAVVRRLMGREIGSKQHWLLVLGTMCSTERVAEFLLDYSARCAARRWSPQRLVLHMTRADIASYLGLQPETVSRSLSRMQELGLVRVDSGRQLTLLDAGGLRRMAAGDEPREADARAGDAAGGTGAVRQAPVAANRSIARPTNTAAPNQLL
jgi:CRP/FNR family transcriptional regulator, anaerobic regulatory protein